MARQLCMAAGMSCSSARSLTRQVRGWEAAEHTPTAWRSAYAKAFDMSEQELFAELSGHSSHESEKGVEPSRTRHEWVVANEDRQAMHLAAIGTSAKTITGDPLEVSQASPHDPTLLVQAISSLRQEIDVTVNNTTVTDATDDHWRTVADGYGRTYRTTPPLVFLLSISEDLAELHRLIARPLLTKQRRGLYHSAARMAGLLATTLINLGKYREAQGWFHTAIRAAQESEDCALQAWVLVRHAVSALYWGDPRGSIDLTERAIQLAAGMPCVAAAWAPAVQARAMAQLGNAEAAYEAIVAAETAFDRVQAQIHEQHAYGYTAAQLHFYRSNTLTQIGDCTAAFDAQAIALALYSPNEFLDPSLIHVDHALCLALDGRPDEAAQYTTKMILGLPPDRRSPIIVARALDVKAAIPTTCQTEPEVQALQRALALPRADATVD
ncbi:hypothetical protein ACQEVF_56840 [Nonomuraea polychroma]|uniref:hypothetical protein n=1 Tax=Nonomuraea polychroma TaxID=46176 RepID=UPI003D945739